MLEQLDEQHLVQELARKAQQELQHLHCLQLAEDRRGRAEHSRLCAIADEAVGCRVRPLTAQAGTAAVGAHDLQLSFILIDTRSTAGTPARIAASLTRNFDAKLSVQSTTTSAAATSSAALPASNRPRTARMRTVGL